jgi:four helix bundle protein
MLQGHRDLKVYQLAYKLAMEIFNESKTFPIEERYSLTDQIRRSSRSVATNIAEAFRKRRYRNMFVNKLSDSDTEATETQVWLDFSLDCGYLSRGSHEKLVKGYEEIGKMLGSMMSTPEKFNIS